MGVMAENLLRNLAKTCAGFDQNIVQKRTTMFLFSGVTVALQRWSYSGVTKFTGGGGLKTAICYDKQIIFHSVRGRGGMRFRFSECHTFCKAPNRKRKGVIFPIFERNKKITLTLTGVELLWLPRMK